MTDIVEGQAIPATLCAHNAEGQTLVAEAGRKVRCRKCAAVLAPEARGVVAGASQVVPSAVQETRPTSTSLGILAQYPGHGPY